MDTTVSLTVTQEKNLAELESRVNAARRLLRDRDTAEARAVASLLASSYGTVRYHATRGGATGLLARHVDRVAHEVLGLRWA